MFCIVRCYNRFFYKKLPKQKVSTTNLPWLWIGVELKDDKIETITELVNTNVEYGDAITIEHLEALTNIKDAKRWLYLDSKTLNEQEIPAEGLVIEDDSQ